MCAHHGAGALAVEVEVAHVKIAAGAVEFGAIGGVDGAGQTVLVLFTTFNPSSKLATLMIASTGPKISS